MQIARRCRSTPTDSPTTCSATCAPVYTVWGDEPLLAQEAADAIRAAARAAGCSERQVHTVAGAHFDWSSLLGASQALSLFADRQLVEIRIPSGKPGKDGSEALQRYCEIAIAGGGRDVITLVQLPRLDRSQQSSAWFAALDRAGVTIRVDPVERKALPAWIAAAPGGAGPARRRRRRRPAHARLLRRSRRGQPARRAPGDPEARACSTRPARSASSRSRARCSTSPATTSFELGEAVLAGQAARALRMLDGLRSRRRGGGARALDAGRGHPRPEARQGRARRRQAAAAGAARGARLGREGARLRARRRRC